MFPKQRAGKNGWTKWIKPADKYLAKCCERY